MWCGDGVAVEARYLEFKLRRLRWGTPRRSARLALRRWLNEGKVTGEVAVAWRKMVVASWG